MGKILNGDIFFVSMLDWYKEHGRDLPWRKTRDPYKVLVSELMLQQTQVSRVIPKYEQFLETFPTLPDLARGERADVLRLWQGLGYNSRAVRLHTLAKIVVEEREGKLPETYEELLELPGIGPYTAGAVMIFAHDVAAPSVDVNVERVVRRMFWTKRQRPTKKAVDEKAFALLQQAESPHDWHSAMMDFGSSICTATPNCAECPFTQKCQSRGKHPLEEKKPKQKKFKGSNRMYRGKILKLLLEQPMTKKELFAQLDDVKARAALNQLVAEDIVKEEGLLRVK